MTCIVGFVYDKKVFMGGDSAGVGNQKIRTRINRREEQISIKARCF